MSTKAVVLMNLGSPDSTAVSDVRKYLHEFLMDKRVIDYPWLFRKLLVDGVIVRTRAPKSAEAYKSIWWKEGSPLIVLTKKLQSALQEQLPIPVEIAMRYGNPDMKSAYDRLYKDNPDLEEVLLVPLYPHYAMSSYETAVVHAVQEHARGKYPFGIHILQPYYNDPAYIDALASSVKPFLAEPYDHMLFSYHGVPERHILKGDITGTHCLKSADCCSVDSPAHAKCYRHQVLETTRLTAEKLGLAAGKYSVTFQSRLGRDKWLEPYTAATLETLPAKGIKRLVMACPAFVSDCLETLEEIAVEGKKSFLDAGGESFTVIPCLNTDAQWINALTGWVSEEPKDTSKWTQAI